MVTVKNAVETHKYSLGIRKIFPKQFKLLDGKGGQKTREENNPMSVSPKLSSKTASLQILVKPNSSSVCVGY